MIVPTWMRFNYVGTLTRRWQELHLMCVSHPYKVVERWLPFVHHPHTFQPSYNGLACSQTGAELRFMVYSTQRNSEIVLVAAPTSGWTEKDLHSVAEGFVEFATRFVGEGDVDAQITMDYRRAGVRGDKPRGVHLTKIL